MSIADDLINDIKNTANQFKDLGLSYSESAVGKYNFGGGVSTVLSVAPMDGTALISPLAPEKWDFTLDLRKEFVDMLLRKKVESVTSVGNYSDSGSFGMGVVGDFFSSFYPSKGRKGSMTFDEVQEFIYETIRGNKTVPTQVQQQWNAARDRELSEARRLEDEAYTQSAAKGFSMPPLTTTYRVLGVHQTASKNLSATNREIAIESAKLQMDFVKTMIDEAIKVREQSIAQVIQYYQGIVAKEREINLQEAQAYLQAYQVFYSALSAYYNSFAEIQKLKVDVAEGNLKYAMQDRQMVIDYKKSDEQRKTNAYTESARNAISVASAALSGLNALVVQANSTTG